MPNESLKDATLKGVRWVMLARIVIETSALGVTVALARLMPPAEFGRAAVALIFVPLAAIITYEGFASALVQRKSYDENHARAAALTSLLGGAVLSGLLFALAGPVGGALFGDRIADLIMLVSPIFLIASIGAVSRALLLRRLDFRRTSLIEIASLAGGNAVALGLAIGGIDAAAIVFGGLAQSAIASLLLLIAAPPPLPRWHGRSQRDISAFGIPAAAAGLVHVMFQNVDYAILAARVSATQTGIFWRAFNLGVVYQDKVSGIMMRVAFPVYSRTESHDELRAMHLRATRVLAATIFPAQALLIVLAPLLIPFMYGANWEPAVLPAQILAVGGMIAAALTGYPQVMLAVGRPKRLLQFNLLMLAGYAGIVFVASTHGLVWVSIAVVGCFVGILVGVYAFLLGPYLQIPMRGLVDDLWPAIAGCLALIAAGFGVTEGLGALDAPDVVTMFVATAVASLAYLATVRLAFKPVWSDLVMLITRVAPPLARLAASLRRPRRLVPAASDGGAS
jgi:O-antigen/teichoic acid export membrane protein